MGPQIEAALDDDALHQLQAADPQRALELLEQVAGGIVVNNVSAFVVKGLKAFPRASSRFVLPPNRVGPDELDVFLSQYPDVQAALDESALEKLAAADPNRAMELIEEVAEDGSIQNVSAYVVKGLKMSPHAKHRRAQEGAYGMVEQPASELELFLSQYPQIEAALDDGALSELQAADPERAMELLEEVAAKGDILPYASAFVVKGLRTHPHARPGRRRKQPWGASSVSPMAYDVSQAAGLEMVLNRHPRIRDALDDRAMVKLQMADPNKAAAVIEEAAANGDIDNINAYVVKGLKSQFSAMPMEAKVRNDELDNVLNDHPEILNQLDDFALRKLENADPERAIGLIEEIAVKSKTPIPVANISAFVVKSLNQRHPQPRKNETQRDPPRQRGSSNNASEDEDADQLERFLSQNPEIEAALDDRVRRRIAVADPQRVIDLIEEVSAKGDVQNISAFLMKRLKAFPRKQAQDGELDDDFDEMLAQYSSVVEILDEDAVQTLREADARRADDILHELVAKGDGIRNPSAFVRRALGSGKGAKGKGKDKGKDRRRPRSPPWNGPRTRFGRGYSPSPRRFGDRPLPSRRRRG